MATINGTAGNDNLQGTSGHDAINGAGGIDTIDAGAGDDIVKIIRGGSYAHWVYNNLIDGGTGYDVLDLNGWDKPLDVFCTNTDEINVDLYDVAASPDLLAFTVARARNFEEIRLGPQGGSIGVYVDTLSIPALLRGWKLVGGDGSDKISDGRGNDTIDAGGGADLVRYFGGNDLVSLGGGDDTYRVQHPTTYAAHVLVDGGTGHNKIEFGVIPALEGVSFDLALHTCQAGSAALTILNFDSAEVNTTDFFFTPDKPPPAQNFHGTYAGNDTANTISVDSVGDGIFLGRGGNDLINDALPGDALIYGGAGDDTINCANGNNWIMGDGHYAGDPISASSIDGGADILWGGNGNDHIWGSSQFAAQGSVDGNDTIIGGAGMDYVNGNGGNDRILGEEGPDRLFGGGGDDLIYGGYDDSIIYVPSDNDHINGNKGNDTLHGCGGDDEILGGQGDDLLDGGAGIDTLTGNLGGDVFMLSGCEFTTSGPTANQTDVITDFKSGEDKMVSVDPVIGVIHPGAAANFNVALAFALATTPAKLDWTHEPPGQFAAAVQVGSDTYLFFDHHGNAIEQAIRLAGVNAASITASDFASVIPT